MSHWEELRRGNLVGLWANPQSSLSLSSLLCDMGMEFLPENTSHPTRGRTPQRNRDSSMLQHFWPVRMPL